MDYISREKTIEQIKYFCELREMVCSPDDEFLRGLTNALNTVKSKELIPTADVLPVRLILQIVQGRLNGVNYTMSEAIKSNDTDTAYKMKGAIDICNEILADLKALTVKDGETNG